MYADRTRVGIEKGYLYLFIDEPLLSNQRCTASQHRTNQQSTHEQSGNDASLIRQEHFGAGYFVAGHVGAGYFGAGHCMVGHCTVEHLMVEHCMAGHFIEEASFKKPVGAPVPGKFAHSHLRTTRAGKLPVQTYRHVEYSTLWTEKWDIRTLL